MNYPDNEQKIESQIEAIRNSCEEAAIDLGVEVVAPYCLTGDNGSQVEFIALFPSFGTSKGTLVVHFKELAKSREATAQGFNISGFHPDSYSQFDRKKFLEAFNEWGWQGESWKRPKWCYG